MNEQLLKTSSTDVLSSRKKLRKTLVGAGGGGGGGGGFLPPPPAVRPRVKSCNIFSVYILATKLWREASELFLAEVYRSKIFHQ